jgi:hypothetical protein
MGPVALADLGLVAMTDAKRIRAAFGASFEEWEFRCGLDKNR